jgi:ligand-binding SRPBCC domain-containing protein
MMRLRLKTAVKQPYKQVFSGFTRDLFVRLAPPFPRVIVERFDGCRTGDEVHIVIDALLFKQRWISRIIEHGSVEHDTVFRDEIYFVDEGTELPFFLTSWQHRHSIVSAGEGSVILDDIRFSARWGLDVVVYPLLWLQFVYRKPIYRRVFR